MKNATVLCVFTFFATGGFGVLNAQSDLELGQDSGGTVLKLDAGGTCWDDCWVDAAPVGDGTTLSILKNGSVVDQAYVDTPLNEPPGDDPGPPSDGSGVRTISQTAWAYNEKGQFGSWTVGISYWYQDFRLRNVTTEVQWTPADPPPDEDEGDDGAGG